jgi:hypothetical protein
MIAGQPLRLPGAELAGERLPYNARTKRVRLFVDESHLDRDARLAYVNLGDDY